MPGQRYDYSHIPSEEDAWDAPLNDALARVFTLPYPVPEVATEGALPPASENRNSVCAVLNFAGTGQSVLAWSDGAEWYFQPFRNYVTAAGDGVNGYVDLIRTEMQVTTAFTLDAFIDPSSLGSNPQVAMRVFNNASALVTASNYALRGSVRYNASDVLDWRQAAGAAAGIGYTGTSQYLAASEKAWINVRFTRGASNSSWHYVGDMLYDIPSAPGTGSQRSFSFQGDLLVPGGATLGGVRFFLRDQTTGNVTGVLAASSRIRITF